MTALTIRWTMCGLAGKLSNKFSSCDFTNEIFDNPHEREGPFANKQR